MYNEVLKGTISSKWFNMWNERIGVHALNGCVYAVERVPEIGLMPSLFQVQGLCLLFSPPYEFLS